MKFMRFLLGLILAAISLSLMFYPIDFSLIGINIAIIILLALGFILLYKGLTETRSFSRTSYGSTEMISLSYGELFLGAILILAGLSSIFYPFAVAGYELTSVVVGLLGLLLILFSFGKK